MMSTATSAAVRKMLSFCRIGGGGMALKTIVHAIPALNDASLRD